MHANSSDLSRRIALRPYARKAGNALGNYSQIAAGADKSLFQLADKINSANARLKGSQIENGIADELAGTVESNVAATVSLMQFNSIAGQELTRCNDILRPGVASQRDHRRMFQQEQRMRDAFVFHQADKRL